MSHSGMVDLKILQVSALDQGGGAEQVAWNLFDHYRQSGLSSSLAVGIKRTHDPDVFVIEESAPSKSWNRFCLSLVKSLAPWAGKVRGILRFQAFLRELSKGSDWFADRRGQEDFYYPGSWNLLQQAPVKPSIVHLHNLHGGYFDPRALSALSAKVPVMLTLHDAWLLSGNCAHSFGCERWKTGCGSCPDISIYPGLKVDSTHINWERKKSIFEHSRIYIATPCQWLLDKVKNSILAPAMIEGRVIHNGVDTSIFHPGDQEQARIELGLPLYEPILLFVANGIKANPFKDYATMHAVIKALGSRGGQLVHLIALGEEGAQEQIGCVRIHYIPRTTNMELIARYYRAADIYVHAAKAETFPNAILEAMACALPVIATNVGGISEQVVEGKTGLLVAPQNSYAMLQAIDLLITNPSLRKIMGAAGLKSVHEQFTLEKQVNQYLDWYTQIVQEQNHQT